jgi:hypothetical protein
MPIIGPPSDKFYEDEEPIKKPIGWEIHRRTQIYLNVPPWICPKCGLTNFGRNKSCPYCRCKLGIETLRPSGEGVEKLSGG